MIGSYAASPPHPLAPVAPQVTGTLRESLAGWRWPVLFAVALALVCEIPFRLATLHAGSGAYFTGMVWGPQDAAQYFSAMRQGAESDSWLIHDRFTQEPHAPILMYTLYVAAGKLAWALGVAPMDAFLLAGTFGRVLLCLAIYAFSGLVTADRGVRRLALVTIALSSGLASVLALVNFLTGLDLPMYGRELNDPELNTFLTFFTAPHLMIGLALLLIAVRLYVDSWSGASWRRLAVLATVVLALGLSNPFPLVPLCTMVAVHLLVLTAWRRRVQMPGLLAALTVGLSAAPLLAASYAAFRLDPFWTATYGLQNQTPTPPLDELLPPLGLLLPLAVLGLRRFATPMTPGKLLVLTWIVMAFLLMYLPISVQRRFGFGLHPMLALVATFGVRVVWQWLRRLQRPAALLRPLALVTLGQALFGSSGYTFVVAMTIGLAPPLGGITFATEPGAIRTSYQQASVHAAAGWLAANAAPEDVILASTLTGNYLAGMTSSCAYVGHWVATLDYGTKKQRAEWFYAAPLDEERRTFLRENRISYVVVGPAERLLGGTDIADPTLMPVSRSGDTVVYRVLGADG